MAMVGIDPESDGFLLLQAANVGHEILNLLGLQAFAVSRHFGFAVADNSGEFIVTLLLNIRGTEVSDLVCFADSGFAFPVGSMTSRALCFVESLPAGLCLRRQG
jgi:hypothetical protein